MELKLHKKNNTEMVIEINGSLDVYTSMDFKEFLEKNVEAQTKNVILNMKNLTYIDSSGIGTLIKEMNFTKDMGGELILTHMKPQIEKVLKISGLTTFFATMGDEEFDSKYS